MILIFDAAQNGFLSIESGESNSVVCIVSQRYDISILSRYFKTDESQ